MNERAMRIRQLSGTRPGREMRWTKTTNDSVRTYAVQRQEGEWPCVSPHSGELTLVLDGEMVLELGPKRQTVRVAAGEACMMPKGLPHALRLEVPTRILIVDTRGPLAEAGFRHLRRRRLPANLVGSFERAWPRPARNAIHDVREPTEDLLRRIATAEPLPIVPIAGTQRALRLKAILDERFVSPPSLQELAKLMKGTEFYVMRTFKKHFGFTPMQYAQFLRTEHFCRSLIEAKTRPTLLRLSRESGFGDYATFERRMRVVFGRAPSTMIVEDANGPLGPS